MYLGDVYSWKQTETSNVSSILDLIQILRVIGKFHFQGSRTMVCVKDICRRTSALESAPHYPKESFLPLPRGALDDVIDPENHLSRFRCRKQNLQLYFEGLEYS